MLLPIFSQAPNCPTPGAPLIRPTRCSANNITEMTNEGPSFAIGKLFVLLYKL